MPSEGSCRSGLGAYTVGVLRGAVAGLRRSSRRTGPSAASDKSYMPFGPLMSVAIAHGAAMTVETKKRAGALKRCDTL